MLRVVSSLLIVLKLLLADIYKEKSRGSAKAQFSVDEVCGLFLHNDWKKRGATLLWPLTARH